MEFLCTSFVRKGNDIICGFNFDAPEGLWDYKINCQKNLFFVGIKFAGTLYHVHGVTSEGKYACLPYMNDPEKGKYNRKKNAQRIDLLVDRYLTGEYSYEDVLELNRTKEVINTPSSSMHAHFLSPDGRLLLVEPGLGHMEILGNYDIITNFPMMETLDDLSKPWYGKDRYEIGKKILADSHDDFSVQDGLSLLEKTKQEGLWATKVSFVYSKRDNAVYFCKNGDFSNITKHSF